MTAPKNNLITRRQSLAGAAALIGLGATASSARAGAHPHGAQAGAIGSWTRMADMPFPVQEIYPAAHRTIRGQAGTTKPIFDTVLVNAGGLTPDPQFDNNVTDTVTIYDPRTDEWRTGPRLPRPAHHVSLVSNSGQLFAIGGFLRDEDAGWRMQSTVLTLDDLNAGHWREAPPLPGPQAETVCATLNGRVHVIGGRSPSGSLNSNWSDHIDTDKHYMFVASTGRWEPRRPLPIARNSSACAVYRSALYVIGGRMVNRGNSARVDVYDPLADRWQEAAPLPKSSRPEAPLGQGGLSAATYKGKIYAFGGEWFSQAGGGVYAEVWEYDPREDKWRGVAAMPRPRHGLGAVALTDGVYVLGGASRPSGSGTTQILDRFTI